jgi:pimeloyl-ACP methyl ester carboxylesterase
VKVAILIHGINIGKKDQTKGLGVLRERLNSQGWLDIWLPFGTYFLTRWGRVNRILGRTIAEFVNLLHYMGHKVAVIGHSNGAQIGLEVSRAGANLCALVFINGAVNRKFRVGRHTRFVMNYYTKTDKVLLLAKWIPFHPWGPAGRSRILPYGCSWNNFDMGQWGVRGHSDAFKTEKAHADKLSRHLVETLELWQTAEVQ